MLSSSKNLRSSFGLALMLALSLSLVAGSTSTSRGADAQTVLKVALMVPRSPDVDLRSKQYNQRLAEMTNNTVQVRIYWGGVAGDDVDVLRKMRTGQIDGGPLGLELVSNFVRQALVLQSPALFRNYKQVDAARAALTPAMDKEAYDNGFKVMGWGDVGRLRLLSKKPITRVSDFKSQRPWLYPQSEMLKEFYKVIGANGVPLGIAEVYGGLRTDMIDVIWSSALLAAALQWHTATHYVSARSLGFISGAFVFRRGAWDALPDNVRSSMQALSDEQRQTSQLDIRKSDERTFQKLIERGHVATEPSDEAEWLKVGYDLRRRMIGRVYTKELVSAAEQIAAKYAEDGPQR